MSPEDFDKFIADNIAHLPAEARIVRKVVRSLKAAGTPVVEVYDTEERTPVKTEKDVMRLVFNLDEAYLIAKGGGWVRIVLGNKWDALVDYTLNLEDALKPVNRLIERNN